MDFVDYLEQSNRELVEEILQRIEQALEPFRASLDAFLDELLSTTLPRDWRQRWHAFVAEQLTNGFQVDPSSAQELEEWIEDWATECGLQPREPRGHSSVLEDKEWWQNHFKKEKPNFDVLAYHDPEGMLPPSVDQGTSLDVQTGPEETLPNAGRIRAPADWRGKWVSGTKGDGVFEFYDIPENQKFELGGKRVTFEGGNIAVGGFPPEAYYEGNAQAASVELDNVRGSDAAACDKQMRIKRQDPKWTRPNGYRWNHAGKIGSKVMELVKTSFHTGTAHRGPAAPLRALARGAKSARTKANVVAVLTVYLTLRDALQAAKVFKPDFEEDHVDYYFHSNDGSVFVVHPPGWISAGEIKYIAGPRSGQSESVSPETVEHFRRLGEQKWGKYKPGSLLRDPIFIPGTDRKTLPLTLFEDGVPYIGGWIDETGVHYLQPWNPRIS